VLDHYVPWLGRIVDRSASPPAAERGTREVGRETVHCGARSIVDCLDWVRPEAQRRARARGAEARVAPGLDVIGEAFTLRIDDKTQRGVYASGRALSRRIHELQRGGASVSLVGAGLELEHDFSRVDVKYVAPEREERVPAQRWLYELPITKDNALDALLVLGDARAAGIAAGGPGFERLSVALARALDRSTPVDDSAEPITLREWIDVHCVVR
jgi:hypothetical protein